MVVAEIVGIGGIRREIAQPLGLEALISDDAADTPGSRLGQFRRIGRGDEQLR